MSSMARRAEFFALEATEYLSELDPIVARTDSPDVERLVRGARALRGASLMAGLGTFARAAAGLEGIARQLRDNAIEWHPHAQKAWQEGLQTLRLLVGRATTWEAADDRQALSLADSLEQLARGKTAATPLEPEQVVPAKGLTPGVRAFIARESALIADSLKEASHALDPTPPPEALTAVLGRMKSLRGIGSSADLSPLPELLDAMEVTTRSLLEDEPPSEETAQIFAAAANALSAMAKSVSDHGRVSVPPGLGEVARELLTNHLDSPRRSLAAARSTSVEPIIPVEPVPIELVGVGDHLMAQGDSFAKQSSPTARDLKLFVLHKTLSAMPAATGTGKFLGPLVRSVCGAIRSGGASRDPDGFATMLKDAGSFLVEAGESDDTKELATRRDQLASAINDGGDGGRPTNSQLGETRHATPDSDFALNSPEPGSTGPTTVGELQSEVTGKIESTVVRIESLLAPEPAVPIEELAPHSDLVTIESLAPDSDPVSIKSLAPDSELVTIESLAPDSDPVSIKSLAPDNDLVPIGSLAPDPVVPISEPESGGGVVSITSLAPDPIVPVELLETEAGPSIPTEAHGSPGRLELAYRSLRRREQIGSVEVPSVDSLVGTIPVNIDELLFRGDSALVRAEEVRGLLANILSEPTVSLERLRPLLDELFDLVTLARDAA